MSDKNIYWTHNTAYHNWILKHAENRNKVLDVGCGDGLLVQRLSRVCGCVKGIDSHIHSIEKAKKRLCNTANVSTVAVGFEDYEAPSDSFDLIVFAASLHHMEQEFCIKKAKILLAPNGKLLIVGCAKPRGFIDWFVEAMRFIPARIGSFFHGETKGENIGVPTVKPSIYLSDIRNLANYQLPDSKIRRGLYYRYLLTWIKPN